MPYGILKINHKKELLRSLWVGFNHAALTIYEQSAHRATGTSRKARRPWSGREHILAALPNLLESGWYLGKAVRAVVPFPPVYIGKSVLAASWCSVLGDLGSRMVLGSPAFRFPGLSSWMWSSWSWYTRL